METGAYGASLSGGAFDFMTFVKQPQTIVRFLSWVSDLTVVLPAATVLLKKLLV